MIRIYSSILLISLFISGCFSEEVKQTIKENRVQLGDVKINYYSDKSVTSLEVPPDLLPAASCVLYVTVCIIICVCMPLSL